MTNHHDDGLRGRIPLSRRNFLAGAGVLAMGAASAGMIAGCSPAPAAESDAPAKGGAAMAETGAAAAATGNEGKTMGEVLGAGWLGEEPEIADDAIASVTDADIVVCGAGHAGTAVARRASELGKKVVVVEMQPEDTFSALGNDIGHLNSSWQVDRVGIPEYSVVDFMNEYQMYAAGRAQPTLISQFANRSGEALDWFIDGYTEQEKDELIPLNWPVVDGYQYKKGPFTSYVGTCQFGGSVGMTDAVKRSQDKAKAAGAQFVFGQAGVRLVHNEDGTEVTGLIAKDSNTGEYHQYNGDAVVLACGDIGSNSAMYNAICRENYELGEYKDCAAMSGRDGSGIAMGMRIGAKVEIATGGDMGSHAFIPLSPMEGIECLWLNKYGERYCNEAFGGPLLSGCAGAREPGDRAYLIWGGDWKEVFLNQLAGHLAPKEWDAETVANMEALAERYPALARPLYSPPKPVLFSELMSYADIAGMYFPFTVESNINTDGPFFTIPATMGHEMAHQCGFMREDEANFIGYLACKDASDPLTRYSGYSLAYDYALSALVKADRDTAVAVNDGLSEEVKADRRARAEYLKHFEGPVAEASNAANNAYLKANQQQDGTRSYGRMVDLLLAEARQEG